MVKRYLIGVYGEHEHPSGDFVHWQDYQSICSELEQVKRERTINDPSEIHAANIRADAAERRAENAERERDKAAKFKKLYSRVALNWCDRAEAVERLAGARVVQLRELIASYRLRFTDEKVDYQRGILDTLDNIEMVLDGNHDAAALAGAAGEAEPAAFRVKDFGDGWWLTESEVEAKECEARGHLIQPLYATPPGASAIRDEALEEAAAYVEGKGGKIPGANAFAPLVSGNRQPCMSGDGRDRMHSHTRRAFDDATACLATAIRSLKGGCDEQ